MRVARGASDMTVLETARAGADHQRGDWSLASSTCTDTLSDALAAHHCPAHASTPSLYSDTVSRSIDTAPDVISSPYTRTHTRARTASVSISINQQQFECTALSMQTVLTITAQSTDRLTAVLIINKPLLCQTQNVKDSSPGNKYLRKITVNL